MINVNTARTHSLKWDVFKNKTKIAWKKTSGKVKECWGKTKTFFISFYTSLKLNLSKRKIKKLSNSPKVTSKVTSKSASSANSSSSRNGSKGVPTTPANLKNGSLEPSPEKVDPEGSPIESFPITSVEALKELTKELELETFDPLLIERKDTKRPFFGFLKIEKTERGYIGILNEYFEEDFELIEGADELMESFESTLSESKNVSVIEREILLSSAEVEVLKGITDPIEKKKEVQNLFQNKASALLDKITSQEPLLWHLEQGRVDSFEDVERELGISVSSILKDKGVEYSRSFFKNLFNLCSSSEIDSNQVIKLDDKGDLSCDKSGNTKIQIKTIQKVQSIILTSLGWKLGFELLKRAGLSVEAKRVNPFSLSEGIHLMLGLCIRFNQNSFVDKDSEPEHFVLLKTGTENFPANIGESFSAIIENLFSFSELTSEKIALLGKNLAAIEMKIQQDFNNGVEKNLPLTVHKQMFLRDINLFKIMLSQHYLEDSDFNADTLTPLFIEWFGKFASYGDYVVGNFIKYKRNVFKVLKDTRFHEPNDPVQGIRMLISRLIESDKSSNNDFHIVSFRGTSPSKIDLGGIASLKRDFDSSGIGRSSFQKKEESIFNNFKNVYEDWLKENQGNSKKFNLLITGHSLGACDSQRFLHLLLKKIKQGELNDISRLGSLQIDLHNAPHPEKEISEEFSKILSELNLTKPPFSIKLNYHYFQDDMVQYWGEPLGVYSALDQLDENFFQLHVHSYPPAERVGRSSVYAKARLNNHLAIYHTRAIPQDIRVNLEVNKSLSADSRDQVVITYSNKQAVKFLKQSVSNFIFQRVAGFAKGLFNRLLTQDPVVGTEDHFYASEGGIVEEL